MNIDDLADRRSGRKSPGERFREDWLEGLPTSQWPSYIDENAQLVADGILIGDTELTGADFGSETGEYYRDGLAESAGLDLDSTSLPLGNHSARNIGKVAWVFNQLREELRHSKYTRFENPSRAIEAAINKALVESIEDGSIQPDDLETIRLPENTSVSTLVSEVFCRPRSQVYLDLLLETITSPSRSSLLAHIDEPRMVTPLWEHQRTALDSWLAHDCRGYVDMATATGKTVLGLAAVAHHFGALHPTDRGLTDSRLKPSSENRATVLVVAHRDLILDQWKREFDIHLNIPEQSSTQSGEHSIEFEWGDVHFWTPNRLQEADIPATDLVVLDETHHYLGSSGFGAILDDLDGHLLALSGSLDDANARSLERRGIPEVFEFTLKEGQEAGVIPQCDWDVMFTPYEEQSQLADITERCVEGMKSFAEGSDPSSEIDTTEDAFRFENLSEARSFAQSTSGRNLKEENPDFREFASAVMARQLTKYNLSPTLSTVVRLVVDQIDQHKCVVLLESSDEIQWVTDQLQAKLSEGYDSLVTVYDEDSSLETIREFDEAQDCGAIIGQARTLGEGVDIETADVCINRGRGRLSRSLVQRMGRILRNPDGDKHAQFYHVSGVPSQVGAVLPDEDGVSLLETASQLLTWGEGFQARPVFDVDSRTALTEQDLIELETAGAAAIDDWIPEHYQWPTDTGIRDKLQSLCEQVEQQENSALLALERVEREDGETETGPSIPSDPGTDPVDESITFVAADGGAIPVHGWLYELAAEAASGDVESFIESSVRDFLRETFSLPADGPTPEADTARDVPLNPALEAVLSAYSEGGEKIPAVNVALAAAVKDIAPQLIEAADLDADPDMIHEDLAAIAEGGNDE